ncbi:hypothetical protein M436DRAFT_68374 [Aureobasidium namibiae CBS 147.97]|uniref:Uncharacterized protein n=1 Tax=Aureobasidium namibiae CBS 147.97 TaxID=1043004 RepID=A0A074WE49_9PEZI|nr:uncharacterized protein M436DRAFT_68374 [Aureobasidium namibiae CBS 147.97]KEQ68162.1 hypothetical protein M436DRAFT_68374 [Aureobasidium namibiae CBS 147.97]
MAPTSTLSTFTSLMPTTSSSAAVLNVSIYDTIMKDPYNYGYNPTINLGVYGANGCNGDIVIAYNGRTYHFAIDANNYAITLLDIVPISNPSLAPNGCGSAITKTKILAHRTCLPVYSNKERSPVLATLNGRELRLGLVILYK